MEKIILQNKKMLRGTKHLLLHTASCVVQIEFNPFFEDIVDEHYFIVHKRFDFNEIVLRANDISFERSLSLRKSFI